jgi:hypothetical protein
MVMLDEREIEIRCGDCVIGMVDFEVRTSRLRVILGDAHLGMEVLLMWTGGPAAIEIDLRGGLEETLDSRSAPGTEIQCISERSNHVDHDGSRSSG